MIEGSELGSGGDGVVIGRVRKDMGLGGVVGEEAEEMSERRLKRLDTIKKEEYKKNGRVKGERSCEEGGDSLVRR